MEGNVYEWYVWRRTIRKRKERKQRRVRLGSEEVLESHLLDDVLCDNQGASVGGKGPSKVSAYGVVDHVRELLKGELAIAVFVRFHDRLVHDLL